MSVVFIVRFCPMPRYVIQWPKCRPANRSFTAQSNHKAKIASFNYFQCLYWLPLRLFVLYRILSTPHLILVLCCIRFFPLTARWWYCGIEQCQKSFAIPLKMDKRLVDSALIDTSLGIECCRNIKTVRMNPFRETSPTNIWNHDCCVASCDEGPTEPPTDRIPYCTHYFVVVIC